MVFPGLFKSREKITDISEIYRFFSRTKCSKSVSLRYFYMSPVVFFNICLSVVIPPPPPPLKYTPEYTAIRSVLRRADTLGQPYNSSFFFQSELLWFYFVIYKTFNKQASSYINSYLKQRALAKNLSNTTAVGIDVLLINAPNCCNCGYRKMNTLQKFTLQFKHLPRGKVLFFFSNSFIKLGT